MSLESFKSYNLEQWGPVDMKLLYPSFWFAPMSGAVKNKWGIYWTEMYGVINNNQGTFYWKKGSLENAGVVSIKRWLLPNNKRTRVIKAYWAHLKKIKNICKQIENLNTNTAFNKVQNLALIWHKQYYEFWGLADVFEVANYAAPIYLENLIKQIVPTNQISEVMEVLLAPEKLSFNQQSQKELLKIFIKAQNSTELKNALELYAKKWFWLNNSYYASVNLSANYFYKKIRDLGKKQASQELKNIQLYKKKVKQQKNNVLKKFKIPSSVSRIASILSESIWLQDDRKGFAWYSSHIIDILSRQLAKNLKIPINAVLEYSADEWLKAFKTSKPLPANILKNRQKPYIFYSKTGFYQFIIGQRAKKIIFKLWAKPKTSHNEPLTGTVVSKSLNKIIGKVRVLNSARDVKNMRKNEVLVAAMTSPDYIHAMRIAKAIITDVGGLMSHAAVVSRELEIPCIVNTKLATKVLKDGDIIEVDANKGVVKKIR